MVQLKCSNARPRRSDDLTDSLLRIPLRRNIVQTLSQIFSSYQNRVPPSQPPTQPNGQPPPSKPAAKSNRFSVKPGSIGPLFGGSNSQSPQPSSPAPTSTNPNRRSMALNRQSMMLNFGPRLVRIVIVGSDAAVHNVVTGYPIFFFLLLVLY